MQSLRTLNIVGCGKVGMTLGKLWSEAGVLAVARIMNRSMASATEAAAFMGAGTAVASIAELRPADIWLIGTPDDEIETSCGALAAAGLFAPGNLVFHCSGALPSTILHAAASAGAVTASAHPIRSFADPAQVAASFGNTYFGIEGEPSAAAALSEAVAAIGAIAVPIKPDFKTVYHAAAVFASNYLVTLLDTAQQAYIKAGIPEDTALQLMMPLVRGTVDNVFRLGPTDALTGPIARGDIITAVRQYRAVNAWDERYGALYKQFGKLTADIAARRRKSS
ncbi:DUF2520 domain-containing protein [Noviherbaspirillum sp. CPCC 100848]|uniref:DUF2520 domain-containing protein n=1 Tax=Noviherbaspirillum album TaxID=3080276 RepID=A0ABU6J7H3_9BURK|nr:DUF2520 domain-containing protein [Noviherbaspirillum sp. CPCC 100848]MEC4719475.1 DUF2520 domain-containing protein [Noviherbaspirillum sp. CPCC 100848]